MPQMIEHIDAIARREQRTVLFLEFHPQDRMARRNYRYQQDPVRSGVLDWLDAQHVAWEPCGPFVTTAMALAYLGQVYLAVPFVKTLPEYLNLQYYFEFPNGNMRIPGVRFYALSLEQALINVAHDAPGYWQEWAEQF